MTEQETDVGILSSYRVLDLTDEKGFLCGKMFGDLGADVIKVERPGGDFSRRIGPFYRDIPDPEKSLYWFAYNANKRGITLDITTGDGKVLFRKLVEKADVVVESFAPGYMKSLDLGYEDLSRIKANVVMTSITSFGQDGPRSHYKDSDGVMWSMGGMTYLTGDPDRPPLCMAFPQSYLHAGAAAGSGTMLALYHRDTTGEGQQVDISVQECVAQTLMNAVLTWDMNKVILKRSGPFRTGRSGSAKQRLTWDCKDGAVNFQLSGGLVGIKTNQLMTEWMNEEGQGSELMESIDWEHYDLLTVTQDQLDRYEAAISKFFMTHTMDELFEGALERRVQLYPVNSPREIVESPQLQARSFWEEVKHPELGDKLTYAGAFARFSDSSIRIRRRAPLIGEHNEEIYMGELGLSREEIVLLKQSGTI